MTLVRDIADEKDYDIDPIKFISAFQEKGIIDFKNGYAEITLPFVESYLLAVELLSRPEDASRYFNPNSGAFDINTFDIYAELGADKQVVDNIIASLQNIPKTLHQDSTEEHILLTNKLRPAIINKQVRINAIHQKLESAFDDVVHNRARSQEKQELLDMASRLEAEATANEKSSLFQLINPEALDPELEAAFQVWAAATTLLGSGSERLDKGPKRLLSLHIVKATSALLERVFARVPDTNLDDLRERAKNDDQLREMMGLPPEQPIDDEMHQFVDAVIDSYEFSFLTYPVRIMFDFIARSAGQLVLRPSVASVSADTDIENLVARVWAAEIDAPREKAALIRLIKSLPGAPFLRLALSTHFLARVYWDHWDAASRKAFLDVAVDTLKPLNQTVNKQTIQKLIDRTRTLS